MTEAESDPAYQRLFMFPKFKWPSSANSHIILKHIKIPQPRNVYTGLTKAQN